MIIRTLSDFGIRGCRSRSHPGVWVGNKQIAAIGLRIKKAVGMHGFTLNLNTICKSALCPNIADCFSRKTATFLILGDVCTRHCMFCAVKKGCPLPVADKEPQHLAEAVDKLNLNYVVITSTTRNDLSDGGASHFIKTIRMLH